MNLPFKIASQYLFTDKFFSKKGLLINGVLTLIVLGLMMIDIRLGIPVLIAQLLPFKIIERSIWEDWIAKGAFAIILALPLPFNTLLYGIIGLLLFQFIKEFIKNKRFKLRTFFWGGFTLFFLYYSFWFGVMFYILSLFLYQLYLGKRNSVHVISRISVLGVSVGTAALILVLSVFNGFEDLIIDLFNSFNADVKITAQKGKVFHVDSSKIADLYALDEVETVSQTLEEVAFFEYEGSQNFGIIKGVDENFKEVSNVDSNIIRGIYALDGNGTNYAVLGVGMEYKLAVNVENRLNSMNVYMPKRQRTSILANAFIKRFVYPIGSFAIQQEFDEQYVLTNLDFARELLAYEDEVSALEVKLTENVNIPTAIKKIKEVMGDDFQVRDRYRQNEAFFKLMNIEKWIGFAVLSFTLLLVSFNMVGALWMLVLEKKKDIAILKSMGFLEKDVQRIFINKGLLLAGLGGLAGIYIALIFYFFQEQVALIKLGGGANLLVDSYPISLRLWDFILVLLTIIIIGIIASWLPALRAKHVSPLIRED